MRSGFLHSDRTWGCLAQERRLIAVGRPLGAGLNLSGEFPERPPAPFLLIFAKLAGGPLEARGWRFSYYMKLADTEGKLRRESLILRRF